MNRRTAGALAGTAALALTTSVVAGSAGSATASGGHHRGGHGGHGGLTAIGLVDGTELVSFDVRKPGKTRTIGDVTGLSGDTEIVGIDYRVQDGNLYGVGDAGGVYVLSTKNAAATKAAQLTIPLQGESFGVDFNPAANALRIVSDTGQNLRQPFATAGAATIADTPLSYPPAPATATGVSGAAYTNNDLDPSTATTLFDLDTALDQVAVQSPANSGQLSGTGKLGVDAGSDAGFDLYSDLKDGVTQDVKGFATLSVGDRYRLYTVSVLTGDADQVGSFPGGTQVSDLAVGLDR